MTGEKRTVADITQILQQDDVLPATLEELRGDQRLSVVRLVARYDKRCQQMQQERERLSAMYRYEERFYQQEYLMVAGVDEAGRGPLAGPVVVGAVILPRFCYLPQLNDSKKLSARQREQLYDMIREQAISVASCRLEAPEIDELNIYQATLRGMYQALAKLSCPPQAVLSDAVPLPQLTVPIESLVHGDALSASIAAASIIAKVERDRIMEEAAQLYPEYGFAKHKGYGTKEHLAALQKYGPCPLHRKSFEPIKSWRA